VEHGVAGDIGPGGDGAAPTNLIATLLGANHRPVRLHGAMLLAYLGDPRARAATLELKEALREDEAPYLDRVLRALGEVRACELRVSRAGQRRTVEACVFNAANEPRQDLGFQLRALETEPTHADSVSEPPTALVEKSWSIPGALEPQSGVRVRAELDLDGADPGAFEIIADRRDLLP
jgi:hypothetical protein